MLYAYVQLFRSFYWREAQGKAQKKALGTKQLMKSTPAALYAVQSAPNFRENDPPPAVVINHSFNFTFCLT